MGLLVGQPLADVHCSGQAAGAVDGTTVVRRGDLSGSVVAVGIGDDDYIYIYILD